jgi:hypothetical protein
MATKIQKLKAKKLKNKTPHKRAKKIQLTPEQTRVLIAKDVLDQIQLKNFIATSGLYLEIYDNKFQEHLKGLAGDDLITKPIKKCDVCAIGAVFVAAFNRFDNMEKQAWGTDASAMLKYLQPWFSKEQLRLMELAFEPQDLGEGLEYTTGGGPYSAKEEIMSLAFNLVCTREHGKLKKAPPLDEYILTAIMNNIVENEGDFVP